MIPLGACPIAVSLESLNVDIRSAFRKAAELGAEAVEFDAVGPLAPRELSQTGRREIRQLLRQHTLSLVAIGFPTRFGYDHLERLEDRVAATKQALALAHDLGSPLVINQLGRIPTTEEADRRHDFTQVIRGLLNEGDRVGAQFAVHTGIDLPERLLEFLTELGPGLGVNFIPSNLIIHGVNLTQTLEQLAPHLAGVHVRDVVRSGLAAGGVREVPFGQGEINWSALLNKLREIEYPKHLTVCREPGSATHEEIRATITELKRQRTF